MDYNEKLHREIIAKGVSLLKIKKQYRQVKIVGKLKYLNINISESTFSNIINGKPVGAENILKTSEGLANIIKDEIGFVWQEGEFIELNNREFWNPKEIPSLSVNAPELILRPGFSLNEYGRYPIAKKVDFFSEAETEIIEFGITMRTYSSHFFSRNDAEFKIPIIKLLEKGVNIKCYLLNPDCNEARLYFEDRGKVLLADKNGVEVIKQSIQKLKRVMKEFKDAKYPGSFNVYTYRHIPNNHFMSIDGGTPNGKMLIAHYLYGELRAKCPVIEFTKKDSPILFRRYSESLFHLTKDAKLIAVD